MTNEEKRWVNEELGKVEDIPEEQVEQMVDEIPQESEEEDISDDPFVELAHEVKGFAVAVKDCLSHLDGEYSIVFGIGLGKSGYAIVDGSGVLCNKILIHIGRGFIEAVEKRKSESGEHEG